MSSHDHTVDISMLPDRFSVGYIRLGTRLGDITQVHAYAGGRFLLHTHTHTCSSPRSPHHDIKVMSVGSLQEEADGAIVWRGPRKTALIKRFLKDTFWGRLDYLIFDISLLTMILVQTSLRLKLTS